jgi:hypothetical protein
MKFTSAFIILFFSITLIAEAQLRKDLTYQPEEYTATMTHSGLSSESTIGSWMNLLNMTMDHSYSMTFSNFGGHMQNINAYTNHMFFDVSENVNAQLDVSVLHSPFGNSFMNNNNLSTQIIIDQARIDYRISDNASLSLQFSQRPAYYGGFGPYGRNGYHSPFNRMSPRY